MRLISMLNLPYTINLINSFIILFQLLYWLNQPPFSPQQTMDQLTPDRNHFVSNTTIDGIDYAYYFLPHSQFDELFIAVMTPSQSINHARNIALVGIITGFLLINLMIALVYILILRRITSSLTMITNSANKMSKGQSTQPVSVVSHDEIGLLAQSFNDMLNNVQTKTAELISERNRSKMILTQLPDGIIVTDAKDRLISANRAAETMLGFSTDRAKGQDIIKYIKNENVTKLFSLHLKESKNTTVVRELMIPTSDGTQENYQITLSPLLDTTYQQTGIITVIRNITDETKNSIIA